MWLGLPTVELYTQHISTDYIMPQFLGKRGRCNVGQGNEMGKPFGYALLQLLVVRAKFAKLLQNGLLQKPIDIYKWRVIARQRKLEIESETRDRRG